MLFTLSTLYSLLLLSTFAKASKSSDKLEKFTKLAHRHGGLVKLNSQLYDEIVANPRPYSVSVVYQALAGKYNCAPCR